MEKIPTLNTSVIFSEIYRKRKFVISLTLSAMILGLSAFLLIPKKYTAEIVFVLKNPLYSDRNYLYNNETKFIDYFANDDDVDRLMTMLRSDEVEYKIIDSFRLAQRYHYNAKDGKEARRLYKFFNKNLNIYRTDRKNIVIAYTDNDMHLALEITKMALRESEGALRRFYVDMRRDMYQSVINKVHEEDKSIRLLTDSLSRLRSHYGIYDIISPSRNNIMLSSLKENGRADMGRGIEEIQNVESVKDELVTDKARHISLANQYATGNSFNELPLAQVVNISRLPIRPDGLGIISLIVICAVAGVFFSVLYILSVQVIAALI